MDFCEGRQLSDIPHNHLPLLLYKWRYKDLGLLTHIRAYVFMRLLYESRQFVLCFAHAGMYCCILFGNISFFPRGSEFRTGLHGQKMYLTYSCLHTRANGTGFKASEFFVAPV
jgi:hypothetical protein